MHLCEFGGKYDFDLFKLEIEGYSASQHSASSQVIIFKASLVTFLTCSFSVANTLQDEY